MRQPNGPELIPKGSLRELRRRAAKSPETIRAANWKRIDPSLEEPLEHTLIRELSLVYSTKEGMLLSFGTITKGSDCHICAPYLSFFEFEKRAKGWKMIVSGVGVVRDGSWGTFSPEEMSIRAIAENNYGIFLESGDMTQGWGVSVTRIYARVGDTFRELLSIITSQSAPDGRAWNSKITMHPKPTGLYDIEVVRLGERGDKDLMFLDGREEFKADVSNADETIRPRDTFTFDGQKYRRRTF